MHSFRTGAHELPKAAKEHAPECHHNPNYVITFGCCHEYMVSNNEIVVSLYGN